MSGRTHTYSFARVAATIAGTRVRGFFEGDNCIEIAPNSDAATALVGADGEATVSYSTDTGVVITLRLKPTSDMNQILQAFLDAARAGFSTGFPVDIRDTGNGEGGNAAEAHVMAARTVTLGRNVTVREWRLFANGWGWTQVARS